MKKNVLFGLLAMMLVFCFTACGEDTGGGGDIPVLVKAYNNGGVAPTSLSIHRAVGGGRGGLLREAEDPSFVPLNDAYTELGEPDETYTPTQFNIWYEISAVLSDGTITEIAPHQRYDFAKELSVDVGDIPPDITVSGLVLSFALNAGNPIAIPKNGSTALDIWDIATGAVIGESQVAVQTYVCYGDTRKFVQSGTVPGPGGVNLNQAHSENPCIVIPFEPKVISGSASSATLNISWNLNNIVGDFGNGEYRLTKGWWNNLYVYASVQ